MSGVRCTSSSTPDARTAARRLSSGRRPGVASLHVRRLTCAIDRERPRPRSQRVPLFASVERSIQASGCRPKRGAGSGSWLCGMQPGTIAAAWLAARQRPCARQTLRVGKSTSSLTTLHSLHHASPDAACPARDLTVSERTRTLARSRAMEDANQGLVAGIISYTLFDTATVAKLR